MFSAEYIKQTNNTLCSPELSPIQDPSLHRNLPHHFSLLPSKNQQINLNLLPSLEQHSTFASHFPATKCATFLPRKFHSNPEAASKFDAGMHLQEHPSTLPRKFSSKP